MGKVLAYLRTSTDKQDLNHQKFEILEYAQKNGLQVDDFLSISISSRKSRRERRIDELLEKLEGADTLIVTELSRLGRSTGEVINLIDELVNNNICVIVIKQNLSLDKNQDDIQSLTMVTLLSLFAQLERVIVTCHELCNKICASNCVTLLMKLTAINCVTFLLSFCANTAQESRNGDGT